MTGGKVGVAYTVTVGVAGNQGPRSGLLAAAFTATYANPSGGTTATAVVSEVGTTAQYRFTIPGSFSTTHGIGNYSWGVELNASSPKQRDFESDFVKFSTQQIDDISSSVDVKRILGLSQDNYMLDETEYDSAGLLKKGRIRVFANAADLGVATEDAPNGDDSEIARYRIVTVAVTPGKADDYRVAREL